MTTWTLFILALLLFVEVTQWSFHVGFHSYVKHRDRCVLVCKAINFRALLWACIMTLLLSCLIFCWLIYVVFCSTEYGSHCLILSCGVYLSHIHFFAILGRCSEMKITEYPPASRFVSKNIVSKFIGDPC